jgi:hypothetical protein
MTPAGPRLVVNNDALKRGELEQLQILLNDALHAQGQLQAAYERAMNANLTLYAEILRMLPDGDEPEGSA